MLKSIEEIYYIIDQLVQKILSKECVKGRKQKLLLSELLTILVEGHRRGYVTSKQIYALAASELRNCWRDMPCIDSTLFILPVFAISKDAIISAAVIALIAIIETMLSARIADGITHTHHNSHQEMLGLGIANIVSGMMGGFPATAALARTSLNIKTGANSNMSATLNSLFMLLISLLILTWFKFMPMAAIAAILVYVAISMVEHKHFIRLFRHDKTAFFISLLVAIITVHEDPIIGILIGTAVSLLLFIENLAKGHYEVVIPEDENDAILNVLIYAIKGKLIYINGIAHINRFENDFNSYATIILQLRDIYFIDLDGIDALDEIIDIIQNNHQSVLIACVNQSIKPILTKTSKKFNELSTANLVFNKVTDALRYAKQI